MITEINDIAQSSSYPLILSPLKNVCSDSLRSEAKTRLIKTDLPPETTRPASRLQPERVKSNQPRETNWNISRINFPLRTSLIHSIPLNEAFKQTPHPDDTLHHGRRATNGGSVRLIKRVTFETFNQFHFHPSVETLDVRTGFEGAYCVTALRDKILCPKKSSSSSAPGLKSSSSLPSSRNSAAGLPSLRPSPVPRGSIGRCSIRP